MRKNIGWIIFILGCLAFIGGSGIYILNQRTPPPSWVLNLDVNGTLGLIYSIVPIFFVLLGAILIRLKMAAFWGIMSGLLAIEILIDFVVYTFSFIGLLCVAFFGFIALALLRHGLYKHPKLI